MRAGERGELVSGGDRRGGTGCTDWSWLRNSPNADFNTLVVEAESRPAGPCGRAGLWVRYRP